MMKIDLRTLADDKTVLKNPHKGWYLHYIDNGIRRELYRDKIEKGDYLTDFPGLNHLYLRVDWSDIEPTEGIFDWSYLDRIFDEWGSRGYRFSFRFCCFESAGYYATPEWVRAAGAKGTDVAFSSGTGWEPDYGDEIFLAKLETFIAKCAAKYDGDPRVEFVDVGTFGTWGEGHTFSGSNKKYSAEVLRRHVDLHLKYFKKTRLILNDDMFTTAKTGSGIEAADAFVDYCAGKGLGARDDSALVKSFAESYGYDTLRNPDFFDKFYRHAPVDIELQHYHMVPPETMKDCLPFLAALERSHASFAGFHGYPRPWLEQHRYFTEYAANRLGYWYFLDSLELPECVSGTKTLARLNIVNRGFAPSYVPFELRVRAVGDFGECELFAASGLNLNWVSAASETITLDFTSVPRGNCSLQVGLFDGDDPIKLAMKDSCRRGDWYELAKINVN